MKRILVKAGVLVSVALALALGWFLLARPTSAERNLAESVKRSDNAFSLYAGDDYGAAKQALLGHIEFLDKLSSEFGNPVRNPYAVDAVTWFVRLAKLEERANGRLAPEYMREAVGRCRNLGDGRDCSAEELRRKVDRMDSTAVAKARK